ncbi:MAG: hypothetical protein P4N41_22720 [Negativicutes bacterium]|nr:hypothetical protein [Negativicutes bacterium]
MSEITKMTMAKAEAVLTDRLGCPPPEWELHATVGYALARVIAHVRAGGNPREIGPIIAASHDRLCAEASRP